MTSPDSLPERVTVDFRLRWKGRQLQARIPLPTVPMTPRAFLPLAQQLGSAVASLAEAAIRDQGQEISCKAGCGACCRQAVPITETEARYIRDLIEGLPEPRRQMIRDRFTAGRRRLAEAGLLEALQNLADAPDSLPVGLEYFRLGIACPFLEDESCSIHEQRPVSCREYLVTSPAENCRILSAETVRQIPLPTRPMPAFSILDGRTPTGRVRCVVLLLAPEWAEENPEPEATETGPELFARFVSALNEQKFPGSPDPIPMAEETST